MTRIPLAKIHPFQKAWHKTHNSPSLQPSVHLSHLATSFSTVAKTSVQQERKGKAKKFLLLLILLSLDKGLPFVFSCLAPTSSNWGGYRPTDSLMLYEGQAVTVGTSQQLQEDGQRGCSPALQWQRIQGKGAQAMQDQVKLLPSLPYPTSTFFFFKLMATDWPCQHEIPYLLQSFMPLLLLQYPYQEVEEILTYDNSQSSMALYS